MFHDIHPRNVDAVSIVIETLLKQGFRFARFEEGKLVTEAMQAGAKPTNAESPQPGPPK